MINGIVVQNGIKIETTEQKLWDLKVRFVGAFYKDNSCFSNVVQSCNYFGFYVLPIAKYSLKSGAGSPDSQAQEIAVADDSPAIRAAVKRLPMLIMFDNSTGVLPKTDVFFNDIALFMKKLREYKKDMKYVLSLSRDVMNILTPAGLDPNNLIKGLVGVTPHIYAPTTDLSWVPWKQWSFRTYAQRTLQGYPYSCQWAEYPYTQSSLDNFAKAGVNTSAFEAPLGFGVVTPPPVTPPVYPPTDFEGSVLVRLDRIINLLEELNKLQ
jgi:hypothetical protein